MKKIKKNYLDWEFFWKYKIYILNLYNSVYVLNFYFKLYILEM